MRIISRTTLKQYWQKEPAAKEALNAWFTEVSKAHWPTPAAVKEKYGNASILRDGRMVFNICGNNHRLVVWINYEFYSVPADSRRAR